MMYQVEMPIYHCVFLCHLSFSDVFIGNLLFQRKKRRRRHTREQNLYLQLSEGMDCLEHICREGCTSVGPYDEEYSCQKKLPCSKFDTCQGLQLLITHFSTCKKRVKGSCSQCKRMWQLLRLHASICDQPDDCRVPLCRYGHHYIYLYLYVIFRHCSCDLVSTQEGYIQCTYICDVAETLSRGIKISCPLTVKIVLDVSATQS